MDSTWEWSSPIFKKNINTVINNIAQQKQRWSQQKTTTQGKYLGNYSKQPSLRELILEQAKTNDSITKSLTTHDKILEDINTKMNNLFAALKDQMSYNKKIELQIRQLAAVLPVSTNFE